MDYFIGDSRNVDGKVYFSASRTIKALANDGTIVSYPLLHIPRQPVRLFTLRNGNHLVAVDNCFELFLYDKEFNLIQKSSGYGDFIWHGSSSIDESEQHICYSEYGKDKETFHIYRSQDKGKSFQSVFSQKGKKSSSPEIRHFHTCFYHPKIKAWFASTGDIDFENRVFFSDSEALNWEKLDCGSLHPRHLRMVNTIITENGFIYCTDDDFYGDGARWVEYTHHTKSFKLLVNTKSSESRVVFSCNGKTISISQAKNDQVVTVCCLESGESRQLPATLSSSITKSLSTRHTDNSGVFYTFHDGGLMHIKSRALEWKVVTGKNPSRDASSCSLCDTPSRVLSSQGIDLPLRTVLKSNLKTQYGKPVEYLCKNCNSRLRSRGWDQFFNQRIIGKTVFDKAFVVSCGQHDLNLIRGCTSTIDHVSFLGTHGDESCRVGVDIASPSLLSDFKAASYELYFASVVFDYIPELEVVFKNAAALLKPGAKLMFYIQPWRVIDGSDEAPVVVHNDALTFEKYVKESTGCDGFPDIRVGEYWLTNALKNDFEVDIYKYLDSSSGIPVKFFICTRRNQS